MTKMSREKFKYLENEKEKWNKKQIPSFLKGF